MVEENHLPAGIVSGKQTTLPRRGGFRVIWKWNWIFETLSRNENEISSIHKDKNHIPFGYLRQDR